MSSTKAVMKAIVYRKYGKPEVLELADIPQPEIKAHEVLVEVHAAALNPVDCEIRKGRARIATGNKFPRIPGSDFSGKIVEKGASVQGFEIGEEVYGMSKTLKGGSYAEYLAIPAAEIGRKPEGLNVKEAASIPLAALTALQGMRDLAKVSAGQKVFLHGASGGVGVYAIQIAKALGARVTATCSYRNVDRLKALGADEVVDYTKGNILHNEHRFHLFYDIYGNQSFRKTKHLLEASGVYVSTIPTPQNFLWEFLSFFSAKKAKVVVVKSLTEDLDFLRKMVDSGHLKAIIDKTYPMEKAQEAQEYQESRRAKGKILLEIR